MKLMLTHAFAVILVLSFAALAEAQSPRAKQLESEANQGNSTSAYLLGAMYQYGDGVSQNSAEAEKWFRRSVALGNIAAHTNIGMMYYDKKLYSSAEKEFRPAAKEGDVSAQYYLGLMYYRGLGVPQDYILAHMWLNLSASHLIDLTKNKEELTEIIKLRDKVAAKMTKSQVIEAQRLVRKWKPTYEKPQ